MAAINFPWTIAVAGISLDVHGVCECVAVFTGFRYYLWLKKRRGDVVAEMSRLTALAGALIGAVLGARILGSLENVPEWRAAPSFWQYFYYNKTVLGGLLGGLAGVELAKKLIGERGATGDLFTFPLIVAMIIGRIGCFSAGLREQTYGLATPLPWGIDLGDGIPRHPVALYEIAFLIAVWAVLVAVQRRYVLQQGATFKLFMIAYLLFRFLLDFIKPGWRYFLGLGSIQLAALLGLLYYIRYLIHPRLLIIDNRKYAC